MSNILLVADLYLKNKVDKKLLYGTKNSGILKKKRNYISQYLFDLTKLVQFFFKIINRSTI